MYFGIDHPKHGRFIFPCDTPASRWAAAVLIEAERNEAYGGPLTPPITEDDLKEWHADS